MERPVFSDMLAERRRELGFSVRQASRVLRLKEDVLVAFEEGDFDNMPKSGYAQGMLASYARYLGLDAVEVTEAYAKDLEAYQRGVERRRRADRPQGQRGRARDNEGSYAQQRSGRRGLLPTSGGFAGDMSTFSTTRVRTRSSAPEDESAERTDVGAYRQSRPYNSGMYAPTRRVRRDRGVQGYDDVYTLSPDADEFDDDLRMERTRQTYESAASNRGRRATRGQSSSRPRVKRRPRNDGDRARRRESGGAARNGGGATLFGGNPNMLLAAVVVVALLLVGVLVVSVGSCMRQGSGLRSVPVSTAQETQEGSAAHDDGTSAQSANQEDAHDDETESSAAGEAGDADHDADSASNVQDGRQERETSVSVSVDDDAVTWLEVECDGKSDVAETITGPWQRTYTVEDAITIQAGDTAVVTVVQNGRQVQFESMASGIGTIRIQGTGAGKKSSDTQGGSSTSTESGGTSARTGNASSGEADDAMGDGSDQYAGPDEGDMADYGSDDSYAYDSDYYAEY